MDEGQLLATKWGDARRDTSLVRAHCLAQLHRRLHWLGIPQAIPAHNMAPVQQVAWPRNGLARWAEQGAHAAVVLSLSHCNLHAVVGLCTQSGVSSTAGVTSESKQAQASKLQSLC